MFDLSALRSAVRYEGRISRRLWLSYGAALSAIPLLGNRAAGRVLDQPRFAAYPFTLSVASGDPTHQSVALWTRLAPEPLTGGGMPAENVSVRWELADDEAFQKIVQSGTSVATPQLAHSVHVEVNGLSPDRWYWYRFLAGEAVSPAGRTRTMPAPDAMPQTLRFVFASCQHFESGLFTAYGHMAADELDLVVHLGDYIYEGAAQDGKVRKHVGGKLLTLQDYRNRHAQYRADPLLNGMHARCPWIVTWDDHEVENNYASAISEHAELDPATFLEQRANAYQAYYEMMPLRRRSVPHGPQMKLWRSIAFGQLIQFQVLDTRQYRTDQPNGDKASDLNADALNPHNTMLGPKQAGWLKSQLLRSTARWNVLAQQVMMGMADVAPGADRRYSMDQWPGYSYERMKLVEFLQQRQIANPVVLTGDIHANWVNDLHVDDRQADTPIVATEFVGSSITSGGNGSAKIPETLLAENPFVKFHNRQRGYVRCTLTPSAWRSDYQIVAEVTKPGGAVHTLQSFVVENGQAGANPA